MRHKKIRAVMDCNCRAEIQGGNGGLKISKVFNG